MIAKSTEKHDNRNSEKYFHTFFFSKGTTRGYSRCKSRENLLMILYSRFTSYKYVSCFKLAWKVFCVYRPILFQFYIIFSTTRVHKKKSRIFFYAVIWPVKKKKDLIFEKCPPNISIKQTITSKDIQSPQDVHTYPL